MHSEREIDDAIDRAVREIMSVEPRAGLRGRVLAELESPRIQPSSLLLFAGAAALASIAAVVFIWSRPSPDPAVQEAVLREQSPVVPPSAAPATASVTPPAVQSRQKSAPTPPATGHRTQLPRFPARGTVAAANVAPDVTVLPGMRSETAAPLPQSGTAPEIAIPAIRIQPLTVDRIVVAPIPPPR
jgi:hypothetical protein